MLFKTKSVVVNFGVCHLPAFSAGWSLDFYQPRAQRWIFHHMVRHPEKHAVQLVTALL